MRVILDMRPKQRRESGQTDLFRARLDQIVNLIHPLVRLARMIDWTADWVARGLPSLGKDTHFDTRDGAF